MAEHPSLAAVCLLVALMNIPAIQAATDRPTAAGAPRIEWVECPPEARGASAAAMRCGWLTGHSSLRDRPVQLYLVVLQHHPNRLDPTPVIFIPGGPGDAAGLDAPSLRGWRQFQQQAGWRQDIVLFDPRGTGASRPRPSCPDKDVPYRQTHEPADTALSAYARTMARCRRSMDDETVARLGPQAQLDDIEALIDALGVSRVNLWATSFGTRIALMYAHRRPRHVRALVLDSVYPLDQNDLLALPTQIDTAIGQLVAGCAAGGCASNHPERTLAALLARYRDRAPDVRFGPAYAGRWVAATPWRLLQALVFANTANVPAARTAQQLERALRGEAQALAPLLGLLEARATDTSRSDPVYWSTRCAFDAASVAPARWQAALEPFSAIAPYIRSAIDADPCDRWPVPAVDVPAIDVRRPTLVVSGQTDSATPRAWAQRHARRNPSARLLLVEDAGHAATLASACAQDAVRRFWRSPGSEFDRDCAMSGGAY